MENLERSAAKILSSTGKVFRILENLLNGILSEKITTYYGPITNLSKIKGRENKKFREELDKCKLMVEHSFEVLKEIRQTSKIPVIMLTAKSEEEDELSGFSLGVDEYISKPFSPKVLVARVNAVLRRSGEAVNEEKNISIAGIEMSIDAHEVKIDGKKVELSVKEFELLEYFVRNKGMALSREKILNSVWDYDYFGDARTIDTHVKKLRNKMGEKGSLIKTIWGMGYKFEADEEA